MKRQKKIVKSAFPVWLFATLSCIPLGLAYWQHTRMLEKVELQNHLQQQEHTAPLTSLPQNWGDHYAYHPIIIQGHFVPETTTLLQHQKHLEEPAWRVVTPFQTEDRTILVDRGITPIPKNRLNPSLAPFAPNTSTMLIKGILRPIPRHHAWLQSPAYNTDPYIRIKLDPTEWPNFTGELEPAYFIEATQLEAHSLVTPALRDASGLPASRHRGYRNTWLMLFVLCCGWGAHTFLHGFFRRCISNIIRHFISNGRKR